MSLLYCRKCGERLEERTGHFHSVFGKDTAYTYRACPKKRLPWDGHTKSCPDRRLSVNQIEGEAT